MITSHNSYTLFPVLNTVHVLFNYHTTSGSGYHHSILHLRRVRLEGWLHSFFHVLPQKPRSRLLMHGQRGLSAGGMVSNGPPSLPPDGTDGTPSSDVHLFACLQIAEPKTKSAIS